MLLRRLALADFIVAGRTGWLLGHGAALPSCCAPGALAHPVGRGRGVIRDALAGSFGLTAQSHLGKGQTRFGMSGGLAGPSFPALHADIDVARIKLDRVAAPSNLRRRYDGRAGARERVKHDITTVRDISDGIRHQSDRLRCGMEVQLLPHGDCTRVVPDIRAIATELAELHIVDARGARLL